MAGKLDKQDIKDIRSVFLSFWWAVRRAHVGLMSCAKLAKTNLESNEGIRQIRKQGEPRLRGFHQGHQEGPRVAKSSPVSTSLEVVKDGVATSAVDDVLDHCCSVGSERWRASAEGGQEDQGRHGQTVWIPPKQF